MLCMSALSLLCLTPPTTSQVTQDEVLASWAALGDGTGVWLGRLPGLSHRLWPLAGPQAEALSFAAAPPSAAGVSLAPQCSLSVLCLSLPSQPPTTLLGAVPQTVGLK